MQILLKKKSQILPRLLFDKWTGQDYVKLFSDQNRSKHLTQLLVDLCLKHDFDGLTIEVWSQLGGQARPELRRLLTEIGNGLHAKNKLMVLVIPPPLYHNDVQGFVNAEDVDRLADVVDYFSLMTYDYSSPARPGPNSPIQWVRKCVETLDPDGYHRSQILLGLNFYGYDYTSDGGNPVVIRKFKKNYFYIDMILYSGGS